MRAHDVLIRPIISEKSTRGVSEQKYSFKVCKNVGKIEIKRAVEEVFGVKVAKVNTLNVRGRAKRKGHTVGFTSSWKKAVVSLRPGQKGIEFFDTMI
ncbi:MAG: 50S ribosomal protein L23 [Oscillospiraceae bacterium]|jgi:large subunit ribosomal protein L23|nr:50S ribosomal protein L23 [Oscillospiraceae bacterium]